MNVRMDSKVIDHISHNADFTVIHAPTLLKVLRFSSKVFTIEAFNYCLTHCDVHQMEVGELYDWIEEMTCYSGYSTCTATCRN